MSFFLFTQYIQCVMQPGTASSSVQQTSVYFTRTKKMPFQLMQFLKFN